MTLIYVPRLIESAEQAESLPEGTLATHPSLWAREKVEDLWQVEGETYESKRMVGFTALVPIEAEEEFSTERSRSKWSHDGIYRNTGDVRADNWRGTMQTRYTTPWTPTEEA